METRRSMAGSTLLAVLRVAVAVALVAVIWEGALIAVLAIVGPVAPSWLPIVLAGALWVVALVVAFVLLNQEGRFSAYLAIAAIALLAAAIVVDRFWAIVYATPVPPA
jgi:hypothetical protein